MNDPIYVPVLKGKAGEFHALKMLSADVVSGIVPFIDIPNVDLKYSEEHPDGIPKSSLEMHLQRTCDKLISSWGSEIYYDLFDFGFNERLEDGSHPLKFVDAYFDKRGIHAFPTIGFDRDEFYISEFKKIIQRNRQKACLRLFELDMRNYQQSRKWFEDLLRRLVSGKNHIGFDVMLDFRSINLSDIISYTHLAIGTINKMLRLGLTNTFIVVASSFPETLGKVKCDSVFKISRHEVKLWEGLFEYFKNENINLFFGDYGIVHPNFLNFNPRKMSPSGKIRYATSGEWLVFKGHSLKKGYGQYHNLAKQVFDNEEFDSADYSWGDGRIAKCAQGSGSTGNLQSWVSIDTNRHITLTKNQIINSFSKTISPVQIPLLLKTKSNEEINPKD
ncbi:MAG TPA: beta family protein [bacterium]|nr:beta family protein [bacterium]